MLGFTPLSFTPLSALPYSTAAIVGASAGTSAAAAIGATTAAVRGSSVGASTITGHATYRTAVIGHSSGVGVALGAIRWSTHSIGVSTGFSTVLGISNGFTTMVGHAIGTGTATGHARFFFRSAAASAGVGTATGLGHFGVVLAGASHGAATVLGTLSPVVIRSVGSAKGSSSANAFIINAAIPASPQPWFPSLAGMLLPESALDGLILNVGGVRLGWMKSHQCACTLGAQIPGSPNPNCNTCNGRGIYWQPFTQPFSGLITYMHTSSAPDEPGMMMDRMTGQSQYADPTLTIPFRGPGIEAQVWREASEFDAYCEIDAITRFTSVLQVGGDSNLPYQQQLDVLSVTVYDPVSQTTNPIGPNEYYVTGGSVTLNPSYVEGTAYTVEYMASPVYVAFRRAGGLPHVRPFGNGTGQIPRRFRIVALDIWTRARKNGFLGLSTSPQAVR